jgi:hypothetical protein
MAETLTDNLKLSKRDTGDLNWGSGANGNLDAIDRHTQLKTLRPPRTASATLGAGAVGANLSANTGYFYKVTAFNAAGETTEGQVPAVVESQVTQPASPLPVVIQWETVKGASGYRIYKATGTGAEKFLAEVAGESTASYTDTGNTAVNNAIPVPASNSARTSVTRLVAGTGVTLSPTDGTGDVTVNASAQGSAGVTSIKKTGAGTSLAGDVSLEQGTGMALTQDDANKKITFANAGITSFKKTGDTTLTGDVSIEQGAGITLTEDVANKKVTIANGGVSGVRQQGASSALVGDVKLDSGTGITLTQDGVNNKIIIAASGGSGGGTGYSTVVVAAPSGNATTDTGNINTAMTSIASLGGTAQLREGTYQISANLSIPAKVTLRGMGRGGTILKGQTALDSAHVPIITMAGANSGLKELTVDISLLAGGQNYGDISIAASDFEIADCFFDAFKNEGLFLASSVARGFIHGCGFRNWFDCVFRADTSVTDIRVVNCGFLTTTGSDVCILGNTCMRWAFTNCTGDGVRIVFNSAMPPKSSMTNCVWNLGGFVSGFTMGTDCVLSGCTIINPSTNANVAVIIINSGDSNALISGNRLISGSQGKGIWAFGSNHVITGNRITAPSGIQLEGSGNAVSGNRIETGAIVLQPGVSGNNVVGNKATVTDSSGQSNVIANNG